MNCKDKKGRYKCNKCKWFQKIVDLQGNKVWRCTY